MPLPTRINTLRSYGSLVKKATTFSFQVTIYDKAMLTVSLYYLINGLYAEQDRLLAEQYTAAASQLFENAFNGKNDTACWGLIWLANLFLSKS